MLLQEKIQKKLKEMGKNYNTHQGYLVTVSKLFNSIKKPIYFGLFMKMYLLARENIEKGFFGVSMEYTYFSKNLLMDHRTVKRLIGYMEKNGILTVINPPKQNEPTIYLFNELFSNDQDYIQIFCDITGYSKGEK